MKPIYFRQNQLRNSNAGNHFSVLQSNFKPRTKSCKVLGRKVKELHAQVMLSSISPTEGHGLRKECEILEQLAM